MKKRIFGLLLVACMLVGLLPMTAFAETDQPVFYLEYSAKDTGHTDGPIGVRAEMKAGDAPKYWVTGEFDAANYANVYFMQESTEVNWNVKLEYPVDDYLRVFDGITYWNMLAPKEKNELRDDLDRMISRTPGKKRMTGCYIWNYGEGKPLTPDELKFECETYYEYLKAGKTEGIIFCSNCCADVGGPAIDFLRGWIREAGEEEIK